MLPAKIGGAMDTPGAGIDIAGLMAAFKVLAAFILAFAVLGLTAVVALAVQEAQRPVQGRDRHRLKPGPAARAAEEAAVKAASRELALPIATPQFRGPLQN